MPERNRISNILRLLQDTTELKLLATVKHLISHIEMVCTYAIACLQSTHNLCKQEQQPSVAVHVRTVHACSCTTNKLSSLMS